jgi:hypothetical protein
MSKETSKKNYRYKYLELLAEVKDEYYSTEEALSISRFIEKYDAASDFSKISFSWNGAHATEFKDFNQDFRDKISIFICLNNNIKVPHTLLKDLVQEIGKASQNAWGAPEYVFILSELLLKETRGTYVETFGEMLFSNMDTYGACISMDFTGIDVEGILNELRQKDPKSKLVLDLIEYFEAHL